jgi:hypothetical protein
MKFWIWIDMTKIQIQNPIFSLDYQSQSNPRIAIRIEQSNTAIPCLLDISNKNTNATFFSSEEVIFWEFRVVFEFTLMTICEQKKRGQTEKKAEKV